MLWSRRRARKRLPIWELALCLRKWDQTFMVRTASLLRASNDETLTVRASNRRG